MLAQWLQIDIAQRINNEITTPRGFMTADRNADLHQTKFFPIRMQTVCFGIDRDATGSFDLANQIGELLLRRAASLIRFFSAMYLTAIRSKAIRRSFWSHGGYR